MEAIQDIFINLLADAIWALGGFLIARYLVLKKPSRLRFRNY
jgi:hypothetical protein